MRLTFEGNAMKIRDYNNTLKLELHLSDNQQNAEVGYISDVRNLKNIAFYSHNDDSVSVSKDAILGWDIRFSNDIDWHISNVVSRRSNVHQRYKP
jgi:hypothetical protein